MNGNDRTRDGARPIVAALLALAVSGCGSAKRSDHAVGELSATPPATQASAQCAAADSAPPEVFWRPAGKPDSLRVVIDSLDARIATAGEEELPALLLAAGRAKTAFQPASRSPLEAYARARPREFVYAEIQASWYYNGADFRTLVSRFPRSELADQAAYGLTLLERGGECEGDFVCNLDWEWEKVSPFLRDHPTSPLADPAVTRALSAFHQIPAGADLRVRTGEYRPEDIRLRVARLDTIARLLAPVERARLLLRAGELWEQLSDDGRAQAAYRTALDGAASPARECVAARLADLPTRTFMLDTTRVVHSRRVELRWQALDGGRQFAIYRSSDHRAVGALIARVPANEHTWIDTTTLPGAQYWYHVTANTPEGLARSNASAASTPTENMSVDEVAVSTTDHDLYVFGHLSNGFPQVARITQDRVEVDRSVGVKIDGGHSFDDFAADTWLADGAATGVLRFRTTPGALPNDLLAAVHQGRGLLRAYFAALTQGATAARDFNIHHSGRPIVAVDEPAAMAWVEPGGGGRSAVSMDCLGRAGLCWLGYEERVVLRSDTRGTVTNIQLSDVHHGCDSMCVTAVFADPADSSAWLVLGRSSRLMHVDRSGVVRQTVMLFDPPRMSFLGDVGLQTAAFDRERRRFWYIGRADLMQLDLEQSAPTPRATTVATTVAVSFARLAPDLSGGVWLVGADTARRVDGSGRVVLAVPFNPK